LLTHLTIQNYALINQLSIDFTQGLSIITGETGAGKSILLGALGLVMGKRADLSSLKYDDKKCIIEAQFNLANYQLEELFDDLDMDYEEETIIRREILPSGKSRAFVNDTPVNLSALNELSGQLVDIHSQHQTLSLSDTDFQFSILDALAKNQVKLASYRRGLSKYQKVERELRLKQLEASQSKEQYEYNLHLYKELEEEELRAGEQEELEQKLEKLNNIEEIKLQLSESYQLAASEEIGIQNQLHSLESKLQRISGFAASYEELANRVASVKIELDDVVSELEQANEDVEYNPSELEQLNDRLQLMYNLQKKHQVATVEELLVIFDQLAVKVAQVEGADEALAGLLAEQAKIAEKLDDVAGRITEARTKVIPKLIKELKKLLTSLGMPNANFQIELAPSTSYLANGKDQLSFLFAANKGGSFGELKKVASGGELSRIMLSIKNILSKNIKLPTIIFDEIDTGVSGEVSNKIAAIMDDMAKHMQVITITHLPQIAAKGQQHYKVYKGDVDGVTTSNLKQLNTEERIAEIAEMLSGKDYSASALTHAKELLEL
jgi:DNA repair protein RecN (Recombination protein N)